MCFEIDRIAKNWKKRIVWKIVRARKNRAGRLVFTSPQQSFQALEYRQGKSKSIRVGKCTHNDLGKTRAGIYVCKTLAAAREYAKEWSLYGYSFRAIKLTVDPKDFLFSSAGCRHRQCATYRKVFVTDVAFKL